MFNLQDFYDGKIMINIKGATQEDLIKLGKEIGRCYCDGRDLSHIVSEHADLYIRTINDKKNSIVPHFYDYDLPCVLVKEALKQLDNKIPIEESDWKSIYDQP